MINCRTLNLLIFYFLSFFTYSCPALSSNPDNLIDDEINLEEILSDLPDNLNPGKMTVTQLSCLPYFDSESSELFIKFRNSNNSEWREILSSSGIPGLTPLQNIILDFLANTENVVNKENSYNASVRSGLSYKPGDDSPGDGRYYMRFKGEVNDSFKLNVLTERDRLEPRALDLFSACAAFKTNAYKTELLIGDYCPNYGQGLLFGRYSSFYPDGTGIINSDSGNYMNAFFNESRFLRGLHLKTELESIELRLWFSSRKMDASLDDEGNAVSIDYSGTHLSGKGRNELSEKIYGSRISYNLKDKFSIGASGVYAGYNPEFSIPEDERHVNYQSGSVFRYLSVDGGLKIKPLKVFFEKSVGLDGGDAFNRRS